MSLTDDIIESKTLVVFTEKHHLQNVELMVRLEEKVDKLISMQVIPQDDYVSVPQFMEITGLKRTTISAMIAGKHESGFKLKTQRRPGSSWKWIPKSEILRWRNFYRDQYPELKKQFQS